VVPQESFPPAQLFGIEYQQPWNPQVTTTPWLSQEQAPTVTIQEPPGITSHHIPDTETPPQNPNQQPLRLPPVPDTLKEIPSSPSYLTPQRQHHKTKLGFTVAGLCIFIGAILMMIVFIMAQSLPSSDNLTQTPASTKSASNQITPTSVARPSSTVTVTETPVLSGSQYIDNARMASSVSSTGQLLQASSNFTVGQTIYVTMTVHQIAYPGTICLNWYINNRLVTPFTYSANPGDLSLPQSNAYFYIQPTAAGPGYVEIYWASTTSCTDETLAQRVTFTVSAI
jgi:hypothetical protein